MEELIGGMIIGSVVTALFPRLTRGVLRAVSWTSSRVGELAGDATGSVRQMWHEAREEAEAARGRGEGSAERDEHGRFIPTHGHNQR